MHLGIQTHKVSFVTSHSRCYTHRPRVARLNRVGTYPLGIARKLTLSRPRVAFRGPKIGSRSSVVSRCSLIFYSPSEILRTLSTLAVLRFSRYSRYSSYWSLIGKGAGRLQIQRPSFFRTTTRLSTLPRLIELLEMPDCSASSKISPAGRAPLCSIACKNSAARSTAVSFRGSSGASSHSTPASVIRKPSGPGIGPRFDFKTESRSRS